MDDRKASYALPARKASRFRKSVIEPFPDLDWSSNFTQDDDAGDVPAPVFGPRYGSIANQGAGIDTTAAIGKDGRINIDVKDQKRRLSNLLTPAFRNQLDIQESHRVKHVPTYLTGGLGEAPPPPLNIVIQICGSRGDVQPFVALGKILKKDYGHRIRVATHPNFKTFVEENGLEFFSIGGDPSELMAFMVKNPGLMPGFDTLRSGDVGKRRKDIATMIRGCWRSCIEPGDGLGPEAGEEELEDWQSAVSVGRAAGMAEPFIAEAIIANPPSFAHIHCAEKLGIPLHMMFTMPWSPTQSFPHPLANIMSTDADPKMTNFLSYALVDMMTWQGLGDVINRFRQRSLGLEPISLQWAPGIIARLRIPWTYCWSPALIPKPRDWPSYCHISGFYFLDLATDYTPDDELRSFLEAGPPPVYIGFGSIVVDDPDGMTRLIFDAIKKSGQRALVSKGWGGFGADEIGIPEGVYMIGNCPHDWLFKRVSCVVHHGGAGTTAAGIAAGRPTVVVPFFGDQPFWGSMVNRARAGPRPVPYKQLTSDILAESITEALTETSKSKAIELSEAIAHETGTQTGAKSFHKELDMDKLRCSLCPTRAAAWRIRRTQVRLSTFAAAVLCSEEILKWEDLKLYRPRELNTEEEPWDPVTGGATALIGTLTSLTMGFADLPVETLKAMKIHPVANKIRERASSRNGDKDDEDGRPSQAADQDPTTKTGRQGDSPINSQPASPKATASPGSPGLEPSTTDTTELEKTDSTGKVKKSKFKSRFRKNKDKKKKGSETEGAEAASDDAEASAEGATVEATTSEESAGQEPEPEPKPEKEKKSESKKKQRPRDDSQASGIDGEKLETNFNAIINTSKGIFRMASAGAKAPMDFTLSLARGFHNAPKLYGDESVRKPEKITGFNSGLKAAGREFKYGLSDGISGLVTQPMEGLKKEGAAGFFKGFGKGIGGVVLKPSAAFWGIPGYTSKGIYKELEKAFGPSTDAYIIASRSAQGMAEFQVAPGEECQMVIQRYTAMKDTIQYKKNIGEERLQNVQSKAQAHLEQIRSKRDEIASRARAATDGGVDSAENRHRNRLGTLLSRTASGDSTGSKKDQPKAKQPSRTRAVHAATIDSPPMHAPAEEHEAHEEVDPLGHEAPVMNITTQEPAANELDEVDPMSPAPQPQRPHSNTAPATSSPLAAEEMRSSDSEPLSLSTSATSNSSTARAAGAHIHPPKFDSPNALRAAALSESSGSAAPREQADSQPADVSEQEQYERDMREATRRSIADASRASQSTQEQEERDVAEAIRQSNAQGSHSSSLSSQEQHERDMHEAIRMSIAETSRGNAAEDKAMERAVRASIYELDAFGRHPSDETMRAASMSTAAGATARGRRQSSMRKGSAAIRKASAAADGAPALHSPSAAFDAPPARNSATRQSGQKRISREVPEVLVEEEEEDAEELVHAPKHETPRRTRVGNRRQTWVVKDETGMLEVLEDDESESSDAGSWAEEYEDYHGHDIGRTWTQEQYASATKHEREKMEEEAVVNYMMRQTLHEDEMKKHLRMAGLSP